jgi:hypothetical protein
VEIPELEFEISADGKKRIDSLYNHIAQAVFNLGNHVQVGSRGGRGFAERRRGLLAAIGFAQE